MTTEGPKWVRHDPDGGGSAPRSRAEHNSWSIKLNKMRSLRYTTLPLLLHRLEYPGPLHLSEASCRLVLVVAAR
jgi:hypothetical protein